jgi:hypothetical protein
VTEPEPGDPTEPLITFDYLAARYPALGLVEEPTELVIEEASELIRGYCGWHLVPSVEATVTVNGSGGPVQLLPTAYLTEVTTVTEDGTEIDLDSIEWSEAGYLRRDSSAWTDTLRGVVAEITHGYAAVPKDLRAVCASMVVRTLLAPLGGVVREQVGQVSVQYGTPVGPLSDVEAAVLDRRYRIQRD